MHFKKRFPSEHLEAADLDGRTVTITIDAVESTTVNADDGSGKAKGLIRFKGKTKTTWVFPVTVGYCLAAMFGEDDSTWIGKRVTIRAEKVDAFGEIVEAVRPVGSPDINKPITFKVRQGRKRVQKTMVPTGKPAAPPPQVDELTGELVPPPAVA